MTTKSVAMGRNKMRKRYMVTEGELFQLYADIQEVRREERREEFMQRFRKLINEAQQVRMVIENMRK